jgi:hypothetical protein
MGWFNQTCAEGLNLGAGRGGLGADGDGLDAQHPSDLIGAEALKVTEDEGSPLAVRQARQGSLDQGAALMEQDRILRVQSGGIAFKAFEGLNGQGAGSPLPGQVVTDIHGNADHPGFEPFAQAEGGQGSEHAEVGFLGGVFGQVPVPEDPPGQGQDPALGVRHQFLEGFHISSADASDQLLQRVVRRSFWKGGEFPIHQQGLGSWKHVTIPPSPIHTGGTGKALTRNAEISERWKDS